MDTQSEKITLRPAEPIDLDRTLGMLVRGNSDPTMRKDRGGAWWRAMRTPHGPATLRLMPDGDRIAVEAWGSGATARDAQAWALDVAPDLVGVSDRLDGFEPTGAVQRLARQFKGLRMPRARTVFQCLLLPILEQKVVGVEARLNYYALIRALAEPAPGPAPLTLPPCPEATKVLPSWEFRRLGIEAKRADTIALVASRARRLETFVDLPLDEAHRRMQSLRGIGPWTTAELARVALGDADAVSVGDYHLPKVISYHLTGEADADDTRMLELLEPYAGHRGRVCQLILLFGNSVPRRGPRMGIRPFVRDAMRRMRF